VANQSLKRTESWDLKGGMTETLGGCNLWLACGGKGRSTAKNSSFYRQIRIISVRWRKRFSTAVKKMCIYMFQP